MPKDFPRTRRVGEQLKRELAELMRSEFDDARMPLVSITAVEVSRDMAHAKVLVTLVGGDEQDRSEVVAELNHAAGHLHHELGRRMRLRVVPRPRFAYDESVERGADLSALIDAAVDRDRGGPKGGGGEGR